MSTQQQPEQPEVERCFYGPPEWDPRGYFVARCPKHPEFWALDIWSPPLGRFHLVVATPLPRSEVSP